MEITIRTKSGHMTLIKRIKSRANLNFGDLCSAEIAGCSTVEGGYRSVIENFLTKHSMQGTLVMCLSDFSYKLKADVLPTPIRKKSKGTAYIISSHLESLLELFDILVPYKYGELCFFLSNLSRQDLECKISQMQNFDVLSLMSNQALQPAWLVGIDIESDIGTLASLSQIDMFSTIAEKYF